MKGMDSSKQAHVVCIAYPAPSHVKSLLKLAKLLHSKGIFITFVNTEFNHKRLLKSRALETFENLPGFRFENIPDGLPTSDDTDSNQDVLALSENILNNKLLPVSCVNLIEKLNAQVLKVHNLIEKGLAPMKDESYRTNGCLDTIIDWIPGMKDIRLKDLPTYMRTTDPDDLMLNYTKQTITKASTSTGHVIHTFNDLEQEVVNALSSMLPNVYTIGPQQLLLDQIETYHEDCVKGNEYSLWEEEKTCLEWLDLKEADSVVYVNFGSLAVMPPQKLVELGWGLANSNHNFLWIIKPDLIVGKSETTLGLEFMEAIKGRGFISKWCPQEQVLNHKSVGVFLTHGGWNSTIESLSAGVAMLCFPFFGDQTTNCKYMCNEWECGMEIDNDVKRAGVEKIVRVLMEGEEGKKMRKKAMEWKMLAEKACGTHGTSSCNLDKLAQLLESFTTTSSS